MVPNGDAIFQPLLTQPGQARPFYCAHLCAVQLAGGTVAECQWEPSTLLPDMADLKLEVEKGVKMVVITTPGELGSDAPVDSRKSILLSFSESRISNFISRPPRGATIHKYNLSFRII